MGGVTSEHCGSSCYPIPRIRLCANTFRESHPNLCVLLTEYPDVAVTLPRYRTFKIVRVTESYVWTVKVQGNIDIKQDLQYQKDFFKAEDQKLVAAMIEVIVFNLERFLMKFNNETLSLIGDRVFHIVDENRRKEGQPTTTTVVKFPMSRDEDCAQVQAVARIVIDKIVKPAVKRLEKRINIEHNTRKEAIEEQAIIERMWSMKLATEREKEDIDYQYKRNELAKIVKLLG